LAFVVVTVLTHLPNVSPLGPEHVPPDKLIHFLAFGTLALLLERARWLPSALAFVIMAAWLPIDEWTQSLVAPSRHAELADLVGGWLGIITAGWIAYSLRPPVDPALHAGWERYRRAVDHFMFRVRGGLGATAVAGVIGASIMVVVYISTWGDGYQFNALAGTHAAVIGLLVAGIVWWILVNMTWSKADPPLPVMPLLVWWLAIPIGVLGWILGRLLEGEGLPGQGVPLALLGLAIVVTARIRPIFCSACARACVDEEQDS
jgi:hypothetical protein